MILFAYFYGKWDKFNFTDERENIFANSRIEAVDYVTQNLGNITVQRQPYFNGNDRINYLYLPILDSDLLLRLYKNGERARTYHSAERDFPGMFSFGPRVVTVYDYLMYYRDYGIEVGIIMD